MKNLLIISAIFLLSVSCVPSKKYNEAQTNATKYEKLSEERKVDIQQLKKKVEQLEGDINDLKAEKHDLEQDTTLMGMKIRTLLNKLAILENDLKLLADKLGDNPEYQALMKHLLALQDQLVEGADKQLDMENAIAEQKKALEATEIELEESKLQVDAYNAELEDKRHELDEARHSIEGQAARLREMEEALHAKELAMSNLRDKIAHALIDFTSDELTVHQKDGKVYVSLEEQLLFESGRYDVNEKGQTAIRKIASVLAHTSGFEIVVEGHTDNVPYHGQVILDNWDLSVKRATSVLRIMLSTGEISADHIEAVGRADSCPIEGNDTPEGRRKNRRTEIILAPDLDQIMSMLEE